MRIVIAGLLWTSAMTSASGEGIPVNCSFVFNRSNSVQIQWNAYPGTSYVLQTTTNLATPWQSSNTLSTTSNSIYQLFPITGTARFFKVVRLDTQGPEIYRTSPLDGDLGVDPQAILQAWLHDETGIDTNSISLAIGMNPPVNLADGRLTFSTKNVLTYTPGTNEVLGILGQTVMASISASDTLGNQTANFIWSFQLALPTLISSNIVFLGSSSNGPAGLKLLSTNGNSFIYSYTGNSSGLSNGMQLVSSDQSTGYTRTVISFTENVTNKTVVVVAEPTVLAEMLQEGSLISANFTEVIMGPTPNLRSGAGLRLDYNVPLNKEFYRNANLLIETTNSALNLSAELKIAANFDAFTLTAFETTLEGTASFQLNLHAHAQAEQSDSNPTTLFKAPPRLFFGEIGPIPVWLLLLFQVDAGYNASFAVEGDFTTGIGATKEIMVGNHWDQSTGWRPIFQNPDPSFSFLPPTWQIQGSSDFKIYLQPKVTLLVYSAAGVTGDLEPYADLASSFQLNPPQCDEGLYAGLDAHLALNLAAWDKKWGQLPSATFRLIPQTLLWHADCNSDPPEITSEPQDQAVCSGSEATFSVKAIGSEPMGYQWLRNGLPLTDDGRVAGSSTANLRIANVEPKDEGAYSVHLTNRFGLTNSTVAFLSVGTDLSQVMLICNGAGAKEVDNPDGSYQTVTYNYTISLVVMCDFAQTSGDFSTYSITGGNGSIHFWGQADHYAPGYHDSLDFDDNRTISEAGIVGSLVYSRSEQRVLDLDIPIYASVRQVTPTRIEFHAQTEPHVAQLHVQFPTKWWFDDTFTSCSFPAAKFISPISAQELAVYWSTGFEYDANYTADPHWRMAALGAYLEADFTLTNAPSFAQLNIRHLTSAAGGCSGGGYSPVNIIINGATFKSCYDPAENHGGSHDFVTDNWEIGNYLKSGLNTVRIVLCNSACSFYWISDLNVQPSLYPCPACFAQPVGCDQKLH